jgi:hypothetical protein
MALPGRIAAGVTGGVACYYLCAPIADALAGTLTNAEAGGVIGWGTGQGEAGVGATRSLSQGLTRAVVEAMKRQGLTRNTVRSSSSNMRLELRRPLEQVLQIPNWLNVSNL